MIILRMFRKERNKCIKPITFLLKYIFKTAGKVEVQGRESYQKVVRMLLRVHIQVLWMY